MDLIHLIALCVPNKEGRIFSNNNLSLPACHGCEKKVDEKSGSENEGNIISSEISTGLSSRRRDFLLLQKIDDNNIDNDDESLSTLISSSIFFIGCTQLSIK